MGAVMIEHDPVTIAATADTLASLAAELAGFELVDQGAGHIGSVWLARKAREPLLIECGSVDLADYFEVFMLGVQPATDALAAAIERQPRREAIYAKLRDAWALLPPMPAFDPSLFQPGETTRWPFRRWTVEVIWRREWIAGPNTIPDDWFTSDGIRQCAPGEVPPGTTHAAWAALGFLFSGEEGGRLMVVPGEMPLDLLVTQDEGVIDTFLADCTLQSLDVYLAGLERRDAPSVSS